MVLVFDRIGQTWHPSANLTYPTASDYNSLFVAISKDGNTVVSGDGGADTNAGAVYVYHYSAGAWDSGMKLTSAGTHYMGYGVAISQDGNTIGTGTQSFPFGLVIFTRTGANSWQQQGPSLQIDVTDIKDCGIGTSLSSDGNLVVFGAPYDEDNAGAVFFFKRNSSRGWNQSSPKIILGSGYQFGRRVAMSGDGELLLVADFNGYVSFHQLINKEAYIYFQTFKPSGATSSFGQSIVVAPNGHRIVIGDVYANYVTVTRGNTYTYFTGAVFIYDRFSSAGRWAPFTLTGNITIPVIESSSSAFSRSGFGYSLGISDENHIVVNAFGSNDKKSERERQSVV